MDGTPALNLRSRQHLLVPPTFAVCYRAIPRWQRQPRAHDNSWEPTDIEGATLMAVGSRLRRAHSFRASEALLCSRPTCSTTRAAASKHHPSEVAKARVARCISLKALHRVGQLVTPSPAHRSRCPRCTQEPSAGPAGASAGPAGAPRRRSRGPGWAELCCPCLCPELQLGLDASGPQCTTHSDSRKSSWQTSPGESLVSTAASVLNNHPSEGTHPSPHPSTADVTRDDLKLVFQYT